MAVRINNPMVTAFLTAALVFTASFWAARTATAQYGPQGGAGGPWGAGSQQPSMAAQPSAPGTATQSYYGYGQGAAAYPSEPVHARGDSDHEQAVGRLGAGFFGVASVPLVAAEPDATNTYFMLDYPADAALSAPVVGVRYWFSETFGVEAGVGVGLSQGSFERISGAGTETGDPPSYTAFCVHAGVPIALAYSDHFAFEFVPAVDVGISMGTILGALPENDWDVSTMQLQAGARIGAEIHFGFLDVPQLALQTSVGLNVAYRSKSAEQATGFSQSGTDLSIGTSFGGGVWDSFIKNVALIYYIY